MLLPKLCLEPAQLGFLEGPSTHTNWIGHGDHKEDPSQTLKEPLTGPRLTHNKMVKYVLDGFTDSVAFPTSRVIWTSYLSPAALESHSCPVFDPDIF